MFQFCRHGGEKREGHKGRKEERGRERERENGGGYSSSVN